MAAGLLWLFELPSLLQAAATASRQAHNAMVKIDVLMVESGSGGSVRGGDACVPEAL